MSISAELMQEWDAMCASLGVTLPVNAISEHALEHVVPAGLPPVRIDDDAVRLVVMQYNRENYDELPN